MAAWTAVVTVAYSTDAGRRSRMAGYDLVVTVAFVAANLLTQSAAALSDGAPILTSLWATGPIFALAVERGRDGGMIGAVAIGAALIALRQKIGDQEIFNTTLFLVAGVTLGYAATTTRRATSVLREALAAEGATAERERLSRSIHDGVLQVLAIVRRRGTEIGGDAAELSALAAEQEVALRSLMTSRPTSSGGQVDLAATLRLRATSRIEVVTPAGELMLARRTVEDIVAAVGEALNNVAEHAGSGARAWITAEDLGDRLLVSVRDDGVGIAPGRLVVAQESGHLGVAQSIRGRIADLGGTVALQTSSGQGTEWELTVPKARP
jgi:signal transduction histidine kinase